ncbi:hypothetical protein [Alloactinosynnema sp. L-07]|uniref:hypothetical protein n=1 Tax=Alloactinosynnema sp. L-07 TaxID=1653480 RepID=UPI00065EFAE2|nr:hypothetical protein [Alloactinosynnema sp. L-07]CRK61554.1 hypothetical protein [Alloactinosynnema sp. L-07]
MRTLVAWVLGLVGAAAAGYGVTRPWFEDRIGTSLPLADLFGGVERDSASLLTSMVVPIGIAVILAVLGLLRSGVLLRVGAGLLALVTVVWVLQARQAVDIADLQSGVWNVAFGSLLLLVASALR